jgi:hypothetical protein
VTISAAAIAAAEEHGDDYLTAWLHEAIDGPESEQDSRVL